MKNRYSKKIYLLSDVLHFTVVHDVLQEDENMEGIHDIHIHAQTDLQ